MHIEGEREVAVAREALGMFTSRVDAWLVAEGVETIAELDRLLSLRVPLAQGYRLGPPRSGMGAAHPDAVALCRRRMSVATYGGLFDLAEHAPRVVAVGAAAAVLAADPAVAWVAVVDEHDRPVALAGRDGAAHRPLSVLPAERLADVARRLASRPGVSAASRWRCATSAPASWGS